MAVILSSGEAPSSPQESWWPPLYRQLQLLLAGREQRMLDGGLIHFEHMVAKDNVDFIRNLTLILIPTRTTALI